MRRRPDDEIEDLFNTAIEAIIKINYTMQSPIIRE